MKAILEFFGGLKSILDGTTIGSRKLDVFVLGSGACIAYPESALGVGIATAGFIVGRGLHDAALAK